MLTVIPRLTRVIVLALLAVSAPAPALWAIDQQKHDDISALLETTNGLGNVRQMVDLILPQVVAKMKTINPNIPADLWDEFIREERDEIGKSTGELQEPIIVIYDSAFSTDEIKQLLEFYRSPLGQKVIAQMPSILQQSFALGKVWGERISQRVVTGIRQRAKAKGYEL